MMSYSARLAAFLLINIGFLVQTSAAGFEVERQRVADRKIVFATDCRSTSKPDADV